jgi:cytochrome P450
VKQLLKATRPGSYVPTTQFPILDWMPDRFMASRERARLACRHNTTMFSKAWRIVESRRDRGDIRTSLCDSLLDGSVVPDIILSFSQLTKGLMGGMHQGASETSASAVLTSILFLAMNPHVQEKARKELDQVCGAERMPQWSDVRDLPYIGCIVKEGMRIRPV